MKKITAFSLVLIAFACILSGCEKDIYFDGKYDSEKFSLCSELNDVRFLIPKEYYDVKQTTGDIEGELKNIENENERFEYIKNRVIYKTDGIDYQIIKPTEFYLYVLNLDGVKGIEKLNDVTSLPKTFGVDSFIKLDNNDADKNTCDTKEGRTRAIFSTVITDTTMNAQYLGYVSIIEDQENNKVYAILIGYGDKNHDVTSKAIAENFYLSK